MNSDWNYVILAYGVTLLTLVGIVAETVLAYYQQRNALRSRSRDE